LSGKKYILLRKALNDNMFMAFWSWGGWFEISTNLRQVDVKLIGLGRSAQKQVKGALISKYVLGFSRFAFENLRQRKYLSPE